MSGADSAPDEFQQIARLYRPLTRGAPEALGLLDDAAAIPSRPGFDLVITKDALVEGVHFLATDPPDLIARKLLRVNLSDLAAKGAEPYGYFLMTAWSPSFGWPERQKFAAGLALDGERFELALLGGDTVSTPGPLTVSVTMLGWVPSGSMLRRGGAKLGDLVMVSGSIGDGGLAWLAARGELDDPEGTHLRRYQLPEPRLDLRTRLRGFASASADISDGLIADAAHVALASGLGVRLDLSKMPLSSTTNAWLDLQLDQNEGLRRLASLGDDYEIVATASRDNAAALGLTVIGEIVDAGVEVHVAGRPLAPSIGGWRHN